MKKTAIKVAAALITCHLSLITPLQANPITKAEARLLAESLVGIADSSADGDTVAPYYIFSRGEGRGFVIVSGDDSTAPILGYTEEGDFHYDALPPQLQSMLSHWGERIHQVQQQPQAQPRRADAPRRAVAGFKETWTSVAPLLKTHWHQSTPYNNLAPIKAGVGRCMTGCVATAGAQVTYYFHKDNPSELAYDTPTYSYGTPITMSLPKGTPIEWDLMKLSGTGTARQDSAVAKLMYALGTSAWLTYGDGDGTATSGHNDKMAEAMKGQFRLNYSYKQKTEYSQQKWEELIYENLTSRRPMLYSGVNDEGGHSVCLDGYQANTGLYHFNFGWGGQGDGYYTVDDATGMNGFKSYQDLVFNITPQIQSLSAEVITATIFHKASTDLEVTVTNDGTLDYKGVYVYMNKKVLASGTAVAFDNTTVLEPGKSTTMTFPLNITQNDSAYVIVTDKSRHVIASKMVQITPTVADLHLKAITVDAGSSTATIDGIGFRRVNNTTATVTVTLANSAQATYCQPSIQCFLQRYNEDSKTWIAVKNIIQNTYTFDAAQTRLVDFVFTGLSDGGCYRAYLGDKAVATAQTDIVMDTDEQYTYFTVRKPDLDIATEGRHAVVTGRWNATLFRQKAVDASVCSYDISGVAELNEKPAAANPNALFYASAGDTAVAGMENVVVGDTCQHLHIATGADFVPLRPFIARQASFTLTEAEPGKWDGALIPFAAEVPYGMQMKQATEYVTTGLATISHEMTRSVGPMTVATFLTSRPGLNTITATDVAIGHSPADSVATFFDGILRSYTVGTILEPGSLVLGEYIKSLYFVAPPTGQTTLAAFSPVVVGVGAQRVRTTTETAIDGYYRLLSTTIATALAALEEHAATAAARKALLAEITVATDLLTYRSHENGTDVKDENTVLNNAVKAYLETPAAEVIKGDVNGDLAVDVADVATIISVMAGSEGSGFATYADVNADGTVDVADIANVIDIMAGNLQ